MCLSEPALVIAVDDAGATVRVAGRRRRASTVLERDVSPGDWVLVGAGSILRHVSAEEAADLERLLDAARRRDVQPIPQQPGGRDAATSH